MSASEDRYWYELKNQINVNEAQRDQLQDVLFVERLKVCGFLAAALFSFFCLAAVAFLFLSGRQSNLMEQYVAFINISSVFILFAIVEFIHFISSSLALIRKVRRLIHQHTRALDAASLELD